MTSRANPKTVRHPLRLIATLLSWRRRVTAPTSPARGGLPCCTNDSTSPRAATGSTDWMGQLRESAGTFVRPANRRNKRLRRLQWSRPSLCIRGRLCPSQNLRLAALRCQEALVTPFRRHRTSKCVLSSRRCLRRKSAQLPAIAPRQLHRRQTVRPQSARQPTNLSSKTRRKKNTGSIPEGSGPQTSTSSETDAPGTAPPSVAWAPLVPALAGRTDAAASSDHSASTALGGQPTNSGGMPMIAFLFLALGPVVVGTLSAVVIKNAVARRARKIIGSA